MSYRVPIADDDLTSLTDWETVTNVPTIQGSTVRAFSTGISTPGEAYTAPNLVNAATGVMIYLSVVPSSGTLTATLQESTVDTAATIVANLSSMAVGWNYLRYGSPYVFTTLTVGAYRVKFVCSNNTTTYAESVTGGIPATYSTDNRVGALATTDDLLIAAAVGAGTRTITVTGTPSIGSGLTPNSIATELRNGFGIHIMRGGLLIWDTAASVTATLKGNLMVGRGGEWRIGTVASPYPSGQLAKLVFNENSVSGNYGIGRVTGGTITLQGTPKSSTSLWKTTLVSGVGTAASPMVLTDAVDWEVNDQIVIPASSDGATNYNETEYRYIKTKNSATSYVLSSTVGGAEAAFTNTHKVGSHIVNIERNIVIETTNTSHAWWFNNVGTDDIVDIDWVRCNTVGSSFAGGARAAFYVENASNSIARVDYSVFYGSQSSGFLLQTSSVVASFTGIVTVNGSSVNNAFYVNFSTNNKTFNDCFSIDNGGLGIQVNTALNITLNRCIVIACSKTGTGHGFGTNATFKTAFNNCESHCNRLSGFYLGGNNADVTMISPKMGSLGTNKSADLNTAAYLTANVYNPLFASATSVGGTTGMQEGSFVNIQRYNQTDNDHRWYTRHGVAQSTGASLADTTVRTSGSLGVKIAPANATTGMVWEFKILARANSAVSISGFIRKNTAFGSSVCRVELFLPNSTTADATQTMPDTTEVYNVFGLTANYTGSVDLLATVRITALTATSSAYVYVDDLLNGTNRITALDTWDLGRPSPVMFEQLGDAAAVWAVLTSSLTTSGTTGKMLVDTNIKADDAAIIPLSQ